MLRYNLFVLFIIANIPLLGMYNQEMTLIPNKPEYTELEKKFGTQELSMVLYNYQYNHYRHHCVFQEWSVVADKVIGRQYAEEQRRYFLVNIMLHAQTNADGLTTLYDSFLSEQSINTPQGPARMRLYPESYAKAMKISNDIRATVFSGNMSPLVLVQRSSDAMPSEVKWSLFKGVAVISYLISLCLKREDKEKDKKEDKEKDKKKDKKKKPKHSFFSLLDASDALQKVEGDILQGLEKCYPILKDYEVKSLVDDKTSWLYDRKNWIFCGSLSCMAILLMCIFRDKIPYLHRTRTFVVIV